jgi:hypothetical protein
LISNKFEKEIGMESSGLSKNAGSRSVLNQSGSTTLLNTMHYDKYGTNILIINLP